ncbi:phage portal protein [Chelativorans oligotrophicus]|uniref:phage portal protein n=1 Tax=Chelativorans oligotrophicus TaxID=449974 RepID=UPI00140E475B|nr:phage portal protein [Chelativorans oligotrophicus]
MRILDWFRGGETKSASPAVNAMAGEAATFFGFDDPRFLEFIRNGGGAMTEAGLSVTPKIAMRNTTVMRCVSLHAFSAGMLPLHLIDKETGEKATEHPLFKVLHRRPNPWQTAFEFRSLMQQRALGFSGDGTRGDAFAHIVRSGNKILYLIPLPTERVTPRQLSDWTIAYDYQRPDGGKVTFSQRDIFHLRYGLSDDGISGLSLVKQSAEAIALAVQTEKAAARLFRNGMVVGGALKHKNKLSPEAYQRLRDSMEAREGAENAHKWLILEEDMDIASATSSGRDSQHIEQRKFQIEDIARPYGVPRPLLIVDDTSWGSGIDVLGQFFVRYGLNPIVCEPWQQAIERDLLTEEEAERYVAKYNVGALLRGSMKDQAEFFAKGLGSGGHQPFLAVNEVRDWLDLPRDADLPPPPGQSRGTGNEPSQPA